MEEADVLETLSTINSKYKMYINQQLAVGNCGWAKDPTKWFIHFDASDKQWGSIVTELNERFNLTIKDHTKSIFMTRK
jgi:hypothetical protein